jgi:hypothetical protein
MLRLKLLKNIPPYIDVEVWSGNIPINGPELRGYLLNIIQHSVVEYSSPLNINMTIDLFH